MRIPYFIVLLLFSINLVGCETPVAKATPEPETPKPAVRSDGQVQYETVLAEAKAALKKAASVNGVWRDTGKLIEDAEKAAQSGDYAKAIKLAEAGKNQGELGYQQAQAQKEATPPSYLR